MNKRILKISSVVAATTIIPMSFVAVSAAFDKGTQYVFDNKFFNSKEDVLRYMLYQNNISINSQKVMGDVNNSFIDTEAGILNKNLLPNYIPDDIHMAYRDAGGNLTKDYNEAKNSLFNPARIVAKYDDGFGNTFRSEDLARISMKNHSSNVMTDYFNVDFFKKDGSTELKKFNPFNIDDFNSYEKSITENIDGIVKRYFEGNVSSDSYTISTSSNLANDFVDSFKTKLMSHIEGLFRQKYLSVHSSCFTKTISKIGNYEQSGDSDDVNGWKHNDLIKVNVPSYDNYTSWTIEGNGGVKNKSADELKSLLTSNVDGISFSGDVSAFVEKINNFKEDSKNEISEIANSFKNDSTDLLKFLKDTLKIDFNVESSAEIMNVLTTFIKSVPDVINNLKNSLNTNYDLAFNSWNRGGTFHRSYDWRPFDYHYFVSYTDTSVDFDITQNTKPQDKILEELSTSLNNGFSDLKTNINNFGERIFKQGEAKRFEILNNVTKLKSSVDVKLDNGVYSGWNTQFNVDRVDQQWFEKIRQLLVILCPKQSLVWPLDQNGITVYFKDLIEEINNAIAGGALHIVDSELDANVKKSAFSVSDKLQLTDFFSDFYISIKNLAQKYMVNPELLGKLFNNISKNVFMGNDPRVESEMNKISGHFMKVFSLICYDESKVENIAHGEYVVSNIDLFNSQYSEGLLATGGLANTKVEFDKLLSSIFSANLVEKLIVYDINGKIIRVGDWEYDNDILLEVNALNNLEPNISFEYVFVGDSDKPIKNIISNIFELKLNGVYHYFKDHESLQRYMYDYIEKNIERR